MRMNRFLCNFFSVLVFTLFLTESYRAQVLISPFTCSGTVTTYTADFTKTTSNAITFSNLQANVGECCSLTSSENCYTFAVYLDQSAFSNQQNGLGVDFVVNGTPVTATVRRDNCTGATFAPGADICLSGKGSGPYWFNVCLPNTGPISITVNQLAQQTDMVVCAGDLVPASNFINSANATVISNCSWSASTSANATAIGLPPPYSGLKGNIGSFTAQNLTTSSITTNITVSPPAGSCRTLPFSYKITVNPDANANFYSDVNQCLNGNKYAFKSTGTTTTGTHLWTFPNGTWNGSPLTSSIDIYPDTVSWIAPGTYTVTHKVTVGTGVNACTSEETRPITIYPQPNPPVLTADYPNCTSRSILVAQATGGTPDYTYALDSATRTASLVYETLKNYTKLSAGTYTVHLRDANACTNSSTITLSSILGPTNFSVTSTTAHCDQEDGTITVSDLVGGTLPVTYSATTTNVTPAKSYISPTGAFSAVVPGTYSVFVIDNNGCTFSNTITVANAPGPAGPKATGNKSTCGKPNGAVVLQLPTSGTGPFTYSFDGKPFSSTTLYENLLAGTYTYVVKDAFGCPINGSILVGNVPGPSSITVVPTNALCGNPTGTIKLGPVTSGTSPYTYAITNSLTATVYTATVNSASVTTTYSVAAPGAYTVTVTDKNTCTYSLTTNVANLPGPSDVALTTINSTCGKTDGKITIGAVTGGSSPFSYSVSTLSTTGYTATTSYTNAGAATYTVNVKDANDCIYSKTVEVKNSTGPTAVQRDTTAATCGSSNGTIVVKGVTGGIAPYTYALNGAAFSTTFSFSGLAAKTHTLVVRDANSCTFTVNPVVLSQGGPTAVITTTVNSTCGNPNGKITIGAVTGGVQPYTYSVTTLSPSFGSQTSFTSVAAGSYSVQVKDASGCILTQSVTVQNTAGPSGILVTPVASTCGANNNGKILIGAVTGGTLPLTYSVSTIAPATGFTSTTSYSNLPAAAYTVTVKDANACTFTVAATVTNTPGPSALNVTTTNSACGAGTGTLKIGSTTNGTAPFKYSVTTLSTTTDSLKTDYTNVSAATYTVTVKDANACTFTVSATVSNEAAPSDVAVTFTNTTCGLPNGKITIGAVTGSTNPYTYAVTPGFPTYTSTINYTVSAGTYSVSVKDKNACILTKTVTLSDVAGPTAIAITTTSATCNSSNGSITLGNVTGGTPNYSFALNKGAFSSTNVVFSGREAGVDTISVKDANNCTYTTTVTVPSAATVTNVSLTTKNSTCGKSNGSLTIGAVTGTTDPYTYLVSSLSSDYSATTSYSNVAAATYSVNVKDKNGCVFTKTVAVENTSGPTGITLTPTNSTCGSANGKITIGPVTGGTSPYTYSVSTLSAAYTSTTSYTNALAATYTVNVKDVNDCEFSKTVTVANTAGPTDLALTSSNSTCGTASGSISVGAVTGGSPSYTYSFEGSAYAALPVNGKYTSLAAAIYTVAVKDNNQCVLSKTIAVNNDNGPTSAVITTTAETCGNKNGTLSIGSVTGGLAPYTYSVSGLTVGYGSVTSFTALDGATYTVSVKDANSCTFEVTGVVVDATSPTDVAVSTTNSTCGLANGALAIGAVTGGTGPFLYSFNGGAYSNTTNFTGQSSGNYTFKVKDANNCESTLKTVPLANTAGPSSASTTTVSSTCGNPNGSFSVAVNGGTSPYTYALNNSGNYTSTSNYTGLSAATYSITVKDANACTVSTTATIANIAGPTAVNLSSVTATCGSSNGKIDVTSVTGGIAPYTYSLNGGAVSNSITYSNLPQGTYTVTARDVNNCVITNTVSVGNVPGPIDLTLNPANATCGSANGTISIASVNGGTAPFTYSVSGVSGSFTSQASYSVSPGTYTVTVKDANSCLYTKTSNVGNIGGPLAIEVNRINATCGKNNGQISLGTVSGGTAPYTYSLSPISGSFSNTTTFVNLTASNYTVTVKDNNTCTYTVSATIAQEDGPGGLAVSTVTSKCSGPNGEVKIGAVSGGIAPYTYSVSALSTFYENKTSFTGAMAGNYVVTVKDNNNCTYSVTTTVSDIPGPASMPVSHTNSTCGDATGSISITGAVSGGTPPYTYSVSTITPSYTSTTTFANVSAGVYTVTVKDANDCVYSVVETVDNSNGPSGLTISTVNSVCGNSTGSLAITSVDGGTPPYTYAVSPVGPNGFNSITDYSSLAAGTYTVTVRDDKTCTFTKTVTVSNTSGPRALAVSTLNSSCGKANGSINITGVTGGTASFTYSVSNNVGPSFTTKTDYTGVSSGTYMVKVKDANDCTYDTSVIVNNTPGPVGLLVTAQNSTCDDPNGTLTIGTVSGGTSPYTYALNGGAFSTTTNYSGLVQGTFNVTVQDANTCTFTTSIVIGNAGKPTAQVFSVTPTSCAANTGRIVFGATTGGNGIYTYSIDNGTSFGSVSTFQGLAAGQYTAIVKDGNGCSYTEKVTVPTAIGPSTFSVTPIDATCSQPNGKIIIGSVTGGTAPYTYSVNATGGSVSNGFVSSTTFIGLSPTDYTVTVSDANACTYTVTTKLVDLPGPTSVVITPVNTTCTLANGSITIGAVSGGTAPYTYSVNPSASGFTSATDYTGLSTGTYTITVKDNNNCTYATSTALSDIPGPVSMAVTNTNSTCGNANGIITIGAIGGGTAPYTYSVSTLSTIGFTSLTTYTNALAGTYTITVKDANACTYSVTTTISNAAGATAINTIKSDATCGNANGSIDIVSVGGGSAPFTYQLDGGPFNSTINYANLAPKTYTISVKDVNSCVFSNTVNVVAFNGPSEQVFTIVPSACQASTGSVKFETTTGGNGILSYSFNGASYTGTSLYTGIAAGTYVATVKDGNNCELTRAVVVPNTAPPTDAVITKVDATCDVNNAALTFGAVTGGTAPYTYSVSAVSPSFSSVKSYTDLTPGFYVLSVKDANACTYTVSTEIVMHSRPSGMNVSTTTSTCGTANGTVKVDNVVGGTLPFTYSVSGLNTGFTSSNPITSVPGGTHVVTVKDAYGCTYSLTATVDNIAGPIAVGVKTTSSTCGDANGVIKVTQVNGGVAPYSYAVNNSAFKDTSISTNTPAGTYTVTVKDKTTCTFDVTVVVSNIAGPAGSTLVTADARCGQNNGSIDISAVNGGTRPYVYSVNGAIYNPVSSYSNLQSGTYTVAVKDSNNCVFSKTVTLNNYVGPTDQVVVVTKSNCDANTGSISLGATTTTGNLILQYKLDNGVYSGNKVYSDLAPGSYTVSVKDGNNCVFSKPVTVEKFESPSSLTVVPSQNATCGLANGTLSVSTVTGGNAPYTYSVSPGGSGSYIPSSNLTGLVGGAYTVTAKDTKGCTVSKTASVTNIPGPVAVSIDSTNSTCGGFNGSLTVTSVTTFGSTEYQYAVNGGIFGNNKTFTGLAYGTYTVTVKDKNNCTISDTISVLNLDGPSSFVLTPTHTSCGKPFGSINVSNVIGGTQGLTYSINGTSFQASPVFSNLLPNNYTVTVKDNNNCTHSQSTVISDMPGPSDIDIVTTKATCGKSDGTITIGAVLGGAGPNYKYSVNGSLFTTQTSYTSLFSGTHTVIAQDANQCTFTKTVSIGSSPGPSSMDLTVINPSCERSNGSIKINSVLGASGSISYAIDTINSINNPNFSSANSYPSLAKGIYVISVKDGNNCVFSDTIILNNVAGPTNFEIIAKNSFCNVSSGSLEIGKVVGGVGPNYTYSINNGPLTSNYLFTTLGPATYTLTVADENTCTFSKTVSLEAVFGPTDMKFDTTRATCGLANGTIKVTEVKGGVAPYKFSINNGVNQNSDFFTGVLPLTHTVQVTDVNGCTFKETVTIPNVAGPYAQQIATVNAVCGEINGKINVGVTNGGTPPYTFSLDSTNFSTTTSYITRPGTHTIVVRDSNNCELKVTTSVADLPGPVSFKITLDSANCGRSNGSIKVTDVIGGTLPYQYSINGVNFQNSINFVSLAGNTYSVTVKDGNGCLKQQTTLLPDLGTPVVVFNPSSIKNVSCFGASDGSLSVKGSGGKRPYTFSLSNGQVNGNGNFTNLAPGNYTVTISDAGTCSSNSTFTITSPATALEASIGSITHLKCFGANNGSAMISQSGGVPPYTYSLNGGNFTASNVFNALESSSYTVTVKDSNSCLVLVPFNITQPAELKLQMSSTETTCSANSGTASVAVSGGISPYTYSWSGSGGNNLTTVPLAAGIYTVTVKDANECVKTNSVAISNATITPPVFSVIKNSSCKGKDDGSLTVSVGQGFTPPFTYVWSLNANTVNTPIAIGLKPDVYSVTVKDVNGCSSTISATLTEPAPLNINFTSTNASCNKGNNGTITANVTGGTAPYKYFWSGVPGTGTFSSATITGLVAGNYSLSLVDTNGCNLNKSHAITEPSAIIIDTVVSQPHCQQADGSIKVTATGGVGAYSYSINNVNGPFGNGQFNNLIAATYIIYAKDGNQCISSIPVSLVDLNGPSAVIDSSSNATCNGVSNGWARVNVSGGKAPYTYAWSPSSQVLPAVGNLPAGVNSVVVKDASGCAASASIIIEEPTKLIVTVTGTDPKCTGKADGTGFAVANGGVPPYDYQWQLIPVQNSQLASGLTFGTHTVNVTDANKCLTKATINLINPPLFTASITKENPTCFEKCDGTGAVVTTNGKAPFTYIWNDPNAQTTIKATGLCADTFSVQVTDFNGCSTITSAIFTQPSKLMSELANVKNVSCAGTCDGSAEVIPSGGTPPYAYAWSNGLTTSVVNSLCATSYTAEVIDSKGCKAESPIQITSPTPLTLSVSSTDIKCYNVCSGTATATFGGGTPPYNFLWLPSLSTVFNPKDLCDGIHSVTLTDSKGCKLSDTTEIKQPQEFKASTVVIGNDLCNQKNGSAQALITGGTSPFVYSWNNGATSALISGLAAGTYTVNVTDANNCKTLAVANVNDLPAPLITLVSKNNISCFGSNDGKAFITLSGGTSPYASETWFIPGTQNVNPDQTGKKLLPGDNVFKVIDAAGCVSSITVPIVEPKKLEGTITGEINVSCYKYNDGAATMLVTGGNQPYSYLWNDGSAQVASTAVGLPAGLFTCKVTDNNGCAVFDSVLISEPPEFLMDSVQLTNINCFGGNDGAIRVTPVGGLPSYTYAWTPVAGSAPVITGLTKGVYSVTVTDSKGCKLTKEYELTQPDDFVVVNTSDPSTCSGSNSSITINVSGAIPPYAFQWNDPNGQTTSTASNLYAPAIYNCLITDSRGCTKLFTDTTVDLASPVIASIIQTNLSCFGGQNGILTVKVASIIGDTTYRWLNSSGIFLGSGRSIGGLSAGTYSVIVSDNNNCSDTASVTIQQPQQIAVTVSENQIACNGQTLGVFASASNGTPPYKYTWSGAGSGRTGPGIHNVLFTNSNTTAELQVFSVSVTDTNNCPPATAQFTVTVLPKISIVAADSKACLGQNVSLSALANGGNGGPYNFYWATTPPLSDTGANSTISIPVLVQNPHSYNLIVSDGCSENAATLVNVIPNPKPNPSLAAVNTKGCESLDVSFTGDGGLGINVSTYEWKFSNGGLANGKTPIYTFTTEKLVTDTFDVELIVTSDLGCKDTLQLEDYVIVYPKPDADFKQLPPVVNEFDANVDFYNDTPIGSTFLWNFGDSLSKENTSILENPSHFYTGAGTFKAQLIVITDKGCKDTIVKEIIVEPQFALYVPTAFTPNRDKKNDVFKPLGSGVDIEQYEFQVFDKFGHVIFETNDFEEGWDGMDKNKTDFIKQDIYVWRVSLYDVNGNKIDRTGYFTLVR